MTEGNLALAAPAGMAGSFLRAGERVPGAGYCGREAWQEEEEEARSCCCCGSTDMLRLREGGWRRCNGSDRVVRSV